MALTPRSFFKSPALLIAAVVSAGIAMFGAAVFISAFCYDRGAVKCQRTVEKSDHLQPLRNPACSHVLSEHGENLAAWSEADWVELTACLERNEDHERAATVAAWGIGFYPTSETLHNIRGYNLIVAEKYSDAVIALRVALKSVQPTTGTMQNNLAWAGLYASDQMTLSEARKHYQDSLELQASSCEAIHTGMWTEYAIASRSSGTSRDHAITAYRTLRSEYEPCISRVEHGDRLTRYEVAGAGILDGEMTKLAMVQMFEKANIRDTPQELGRVDIGLVKRALVPLQLDASETNEACAEIAPVRTALPACRKALSTAVVRR